MIKNYDKEVDLALDELFSLNVVPTTVVEALTTMVNSPRFQALDLPLGDKHFMMQFHPRFKECYALYTA